MNRNRDWIGSPEYWRTWRRIAVVFIIAASAWLLFYTPAEEKEIETWRQIEGIVLP